MNVTCPEGCKTNSHCFTFVEDISFVQDFTGNLFIKGTKRTSVDKYDCEKVDLVFQAALFVCLFIYLILTYIDTM